MDSISADFSNQVVPISISNGPTQALAFADGTEAREFELVHDLATGPANDTIRLDTPGDDGFGNFLRSGAGDDVVFSGGGNDNVDAGAANDYVNGGRTTVTLIYTGQAVTGADGIGDVLAGGPGNDTVAFDQLRYFFDAYQFGIQPMGVIIDLAANATGNAASGIVMSGFENVVGTDGYEDIKGDDNPNMINPLRGRGFITRTENGPDRVNGRGGLDILVIDYSRLDLPELGGAFMAGPPASPGNPSGSYKRPHSTSFNFDDVVAFENMEQAQITGASKNDAISGVNYNYADTLIGLGGNDTLFGLGGSDTLLGGEGDDQLFGHDPGRESAAPIRRPMRTAPTGSTAAQGMITWKTFSCPRRARPTLSLAWRPARFFVSRAGAASTFSPLISPMNRPRSCGTAWRRRTSSSRSAPMRAISNNSDIFGADRAMTRSPSAVDRIRCCSLTEGMTSASRVWGATRCTAALATTSSCSTTPKTTPRPTPP